MSKDFYEFLFNLRASGFVHHTQDEIKRLTSRAKMLSNPGFHLTVGKNGSIEASDLDGEVGVLSERDIINWRNGVICIAAALYLSAYENCASIEQLCACNDYYIAQAETIRNAADFDRIMEELLTQYSEMSRSASTTSYGRTIDRCIQYINQQLYSRLTVNDVALQMGYAPTYLTTLFKEKTGQTLYRFIQKAKIEEAKCMLIATDRPITEISNALCFHSVSHFSKAFKAAEGISPLQFREKGGD